MPLSENEQRILRQIEQQLEKDPTFSTRGYRIPRRRVVGLAFRREVHEAPRAGEAGAAAALCRVGGRRGLSFFGACLGSRGWGMRWEARLGCGAS